MLPIPDKLLREGVRAHGPCLGRQDERYELWHCVLHVAPESFVGGPLALVQDGDMITLEVPARLSLEVGEDELLRRRNAWVPPDKLFERGYGSLVQRAHRAGRQGLRLRLPCPQRCRRGARPRMRADAPPSHYRGLGTARHLPALSSRRARRDGAPCRCCRAGAGLHGRAVTIHQGSVTDPEVLDRGSTEPTPSSISAAIPATRHGRSCPR